MLDVAPTELLVIAVVALLVIGPKDLPRAMRFVGQWVGRARGVARQFRSGFDAMVREAELADMEKKWAEENARIMREHPALPEPAYEAQHDGHMPGRAPQFGSDDEAAPAMTAMPVVTDAPPPPPPAEAPPPPPPIRPAF